MKLSAKPLPVAIVVPWFGRDLKGGAEQQAWQIAQRLAAAGQPVHVLTSCSEGFPGSWSENYYAPGKYREGSVEVLRFGVRRRDEEAFGRAVAVLLALTPEQCRPRVAPVGRWVAEAYWREGISSPDLIAHIVRHRERYQRFLFLPYLFPIVREGVLAAGDRAVLQPCLHDEAYAYLPGVAEMFDRCPRILFNSRGEQELALQLYGPSIRGKSLVIGEGVEAKPSANPQPVIDGEFILFLGRRCAEKNVPYLVRCFETHVLATGSTLKLVLAGTGEAPSAATDQVIDLGVVSEEVKDRLLASAAAVVNLSLNESFSRLIFEGWRYGKPVIVHQGCSATRLAVEDAAGGWAVANSAQFTAALLELQKDPEEAKARGVRGCAFAQDMSSWEGVVSRYVAELWAPIEARPEPTPVLLVQGPAPLSPAEVWDRDGWYRTLVAAGTPVSALVADGAEAPSWPAARGVELRDLSLAAEGGVRLAVWWGNGAWPEAAEELERLGLTQVLRQVKRADGPAPPFFQHVLATGPWCGRDDSRVRSLALICSEVAAPASLHEVHRSLLVASAPVVAIVTAAGAPAFDVGVLRREFHQRYRIEPHFLAVAVGPSHADEGDGAWPLPAVLVDVVVAVGEDAALVADAYLRGSDVPLVAIADSDLEGLRALTISPGDFGEMAAAVKVLAQDRGWRQDDATVVAAPAALLEALEGTAR